MIQLGGTEKVDFFMVRQGCHKQNPHLIVRSELVDGLAQKLIKLQYL